jgi:hypothetical protein
MIAADTRTWVTFLDGTAGDDTQLLEDRLLVMVPVVLTEPLPTTASTRTPRSTRIYGLGADFSETLAFIRLEM